MNNNEMENNTMNQKTLNTLINIAGICLGAAGLVFLLLSIFAGKDTLVWGLLCVALGNGLLFVRLFRNRKAQ
jgi:hypothetical protein